MECACLPFFSVFLFLIRATTVGATGLRQPSRSASGGRTSWAHFEFTRINIEPTILRKKIEDARERDIGTRCGGYRE
jgi:hypothetical protein